MWGGREVTCRGSALRSATRGPRALQSPAPRERLLLWAGVLELSAEGNCFEEVLHSIWGQGDMLELLLPQAPPSQPSCARGSCSGTVVAPAYLLASSTPAGPKPRVVPAADSALSILQWYRPTPSCSSRAGGETLLPLPTLAAPFPALHEQEGSPQVSAAWSWLLLPFPCPRTPLLVELPTGNIHLASSSCRSAGWSPWQCPATAPWSG